MILSHPEDKDVSMESQEAKHPSLRAYREEAPHPVIEEEEDQEPGIYRVGHKVYRTTQLVVSGILLFALIYGWYWLSDPTEFPVKAVKLQATYIHVNKEALQSIVLPYVNKGFIRMDARGLEKELLQLPWVEIAHVQRIWPDTVVIQVIEQEAAARWRDEQLLNSKGQLFTVPIETIPSQLPILTGPNDQVSVLWETYKQVLQILEPLNLHLHKLSTDARLSLELELDNKMRILLGRTDPLLRLQRFIKVYPQIFSSKDKQAEYVDLRYANGLSVKWRENENKPSEQ